MRYPDARHQLDDAVNHVESALRNLSDRLEDVMPGNRHRRRLSRARRAIGRTASSVVERVSPDHTPELLADARRGLTNHPVRAALTAAVAGICIWSLLRLLLNGQSRARLDGGTLAERYRSAQEEGVLRH